MLLVLPLAALVIVLFARIGILWIAIATSPFIVLLQVFKDLFGKDVLPSWLAPGELIKLLLAPVLISFAVSISLVFMSALKASIGTEAQTMVNESASDTVKKNKAAIEEISGMNVHEDGSLGILGFIRIQFNNGLINLSWLITMLFGLGVTWFLLFWAIKQTAIGKSVGGTLQSL